MYKYCFLACFCTSQRVQRLRDELTSAHIREKSYQTGGPIGTKFGTHTQIHLGIDIRQTNCPTQKYGEAVNGWTDWHQLWFTSADSSGNGYRLNTPAGIGGGVQEGHKFQSLGKLSNGWTDWYQIWHTQLKSMEKLSNGWTDWHQLWFTSADSSGNGYRLNTPAGIGGGGGSRGSQIPKSGEAVKRLDRLVPNLAHICRFIWEWIYAKQIAHRDKRGF